MAVEGLLPVCAGQAFGFGSSHGWQVMKRKSPAKATPGGQKGDVASEILVYLSKHPSAEDTLEGIVQWLTLEKHIQTTPGIVAHALAQLIERRLVTTRPSTGGPTHYHLSPQAKAA
jgi:hypothetical protein